MLWAFPFSLTAKSSLVRPCTGSPSPRVTTTSSTTARAVVLNTGIAGVFVSAAGCGLGSAAAEIAGAAAGAVAALGAGLSLGGAIGTGAACAGFAEAGGGFTAAEAGFPVLGIVAGSADAGAVLAAIADAAAVAAVGGVAAAGGFSIPGWSSGLPARMRIV